jgi:hypothetical protein
MKQLTVLIATLAIAVPAAQSTPADAVKRSLAGNWKLVKYEIFAENGEVRPGQYDVGRLMYDERGEMTAHLMRSGRPKEAPTTEAARAAAYQTYLGYFGPYTIDADRRVVVHHVAGASLPQWLGTEQVRYYAFPAANTLTLSLKNGERITQTLTWERVR